MTTNTVPHQCDYARVARRYRRAFQVQQNGQKSLRTMPAAGTIDQKGCTRTPDLENGGQYANFNSSNNPIWGMLIDTASRPEIRASASCDVWSENVMAYRLGFADGDKYLPDHWFGTNPEYSEYKNDNQLYGSRDVTAYFRKNQKIPDAELSDLPGSFTIESHKGCVPDFLTACGGLSWFVSDAFRELVEQFEPGIHQFIPIQGYDRKSMTPLDKKFFLANICQRLEDFADVERSDLYRDEETYSSGYVAIRYLPSKAPLDPIYLRAEVTAGRHYWDGGTVGDGGCWYGPFVSDALWQAMQDAGLSKLEGEFYPEFHETDSI